MTDSQHPWTKGHDRALVAYLNREVRPFSPWYRAMLETTAVRTPADLARLPFTSLAEAGDPSRFVLHPTKAAIRASRDVASIARLAWATVRRREPALSERVIDPAYKPIHWHLARASGGPAVPVGYSAEDVERLGEVGRLRLQSAGVARSDVIVGVGPAGPHLAFWQLALGARRGGVAALLYDEPPGPAMLSRLAPAALAGTADRLGETLAAARSAGVAMPALRTLLVVGEALDDARRAALAATAAPGPVSVVSLWAPPGVRSLWGECRSGSGFHLVPAVDHVEVVEPGSGRPVPPGTEGEVVWTPVAWKGTVLLRLRTGVTGTLRGGACASCGATAPRVHVAVSARMATPAPAEQPIGRKEARRARRTERRPQP